MAVVRNLIARAGLDLTDFEKKLQTMEKKLDKTAKKLDKVGKSMTRNITLPIVGIAVAGLKTASDLEEVQNVVDVSFGNSAKQVDEWAKTTLKAYGLSELSAKKYASTMRAMTGSMGLTAAEADKMSLKLAELAGDMASFYNISSDEAFTKLRAAIAGEVEPMRQLGVNMTVANLEAFALSKGINKAWQELSQAEQVTLRYNYIMEATSKAQGDFARTSNSTANQTRLAKEQFLQASASVMQNFLPALTSLLGKINQLFSWINNLDNGTKKFVMTLLLIVAAIGPMLIIIAKLITAFTTILPLIKFLVIGFKLLTLVMMANPFTSIAIGISLLILGFIALWKKSEAFRNFWINLWEGIKNTFAGVINFLISGLNMYLSTYVFMINKAVGLLNKLIKKANNIPGVNIPLIPSLDSDKIQIPKFAKGGIVYGETVAKVAEYQGARSNPEVIAPLDKLRSMIGGNRQTTVNLTVDGRTLAKVVLDNSGRLIKQYS